MLEVFSKKLRVAILSAAATLLASPSFATVIDGITGFMTTGADMAGMEVTLFFDGGGSEMATWSTTGADSGAATGTGWTLEQSGDTFNDSSWSLIIDVPSQQPGLEITSMRLDGLPGNTVFDRTFGGAVGTPDSSTGKDYATLIDEPLSIAMYLDPISVGAAAAVGDLFGSVLIQWEFPLIFDDVSATDGVFAFTQDTDSIGSPTQAPEPGTLGLFGMAVLGLVYRRRRR